ncbi:MAG: 1-acyl-sn-glycerol-3-phosphate acyltransferase [Oscillospiraceae bacterium]|nr:1-acyl-sn-glycerol-3-phosphate acyltransferase [Oscillospiraceae bacterium]
MIRTIYWFVYFWLYLICVLPVYFRLKSMAKKGQTEQVQQIVDREVSKWARSLIKLAGGKVTVEGLENIPKDRAVLFVSNHQGAFDIPLLLGYLDRPHGMVAKISTQKLPFVSTWMKLLHCVFIDRDNPRASMRSLNEATQNIEDGHSMVIFPEGTRARGKEVGPFKGGTMRIALKCKAPIVPVVIDGTWHMLEKRKLITPANITLKVLPAIDTGALTKEEAKDLNEAIRQQIIDTKNALKKEQ